MKTAQVILKSQFIALNRQTNNTTAKISRKILEASSLNAQNINRPPNIEEPT